MDSSKCHDRAASRFEKIIRFYWDGVPIPLFLAKDDVVLQRTFILKQLNYSPDYYGEVKELPLVQEEFDTKGFFPLTKWEGSQSTISCRIGSHHSPFVGLFRFTDSKEGKCALTAADEPKVIRIPSEPCDLPKDWDDDVRWEYRKYIRTTKLLELYVPLVKEYCPITTNSLRRIVMLATDGITHHRKEDVVHETLIVKDEYTRWICQYVFYYMCADRLFGKIFAPLQMVTSPEPVRYAIVSLMGEERAATQLNFAKARKSLLESVLWKSDTRAYFLSLRTLWNSRLKRIVLFDLTTKEWLTDADSFARQLRTSLRSAFARIRIEFYSCVEEFFFTYVENARDILRMNEAELQASPYQRIFNATRVFLVEQVRTTIFEGLGKVVEFFTCFGNYRRTCKITKRIALKYPLISINMVVGDCSNPRAPEFTNFVAIIRSLFEELIGKLDELPRIEYVLMPTISFKQERINFLADGEVACYRSSLTEIFDEVATTIDTISSLYSSFSKLPSKDTSIAKRGDTKEVKEHIAMLRRRMYGVLSITSETTYCGRFAIRCGGIKKDLADRWEGFLVKFYEELHKAAMNVIDRAVDKCEKAQNALRQTPQTVAELEQYLLDCTSARLLSESLRTVECQDVVKRIGCMEDSQVPIDNYLFHSASALMAWPQTLQQDLIASEATKQKCRPVLRDQVNKLRTETRDHIKTLSTGVTELYNMFNLEICDIAAQTCMELRDLVEDINETIEKIFEQEAALEIPTEDTFEDLYPLLNHFDTIEQFWMTIYRTTTLKEYYASPVPALNMKIVETVREWRRLIHCSTRNVRAFNPLQRLGQQQEAALASFEGLEEFISLVTTPGLRKNHWKEISRLLASKLHDDVVLVTDMTISLERLLDAGILGHMSDLKRIVSQARSDFEVETSLEQMKSSAKKIHFRLETLSTIDAYPRTRVVEECHQMILCQVEQYVVTCRKLRWKVGLSSAIMKALNEWELSTEKTRDMLLEWRRIEEKWAPLHYYFLKVQRSQKKRRKENMVPIFERLLRARDAFHQLHMKISKPQFSLYMAIVQETVVEHLSTAKTAVGELLPLLTDVFEGKRAAFPRFHFLSDVQLMTFLSSFNLTELKLLLRHLYSRLTDFEVKHNCVVAFTAADGSTIKATPALPIKDSLKSEWICQFDTTLANSVFAAMKECYMDYGSSTLSNWISSHCPQMVLMALRCTHTKRMRHAISFSSGQGLIAYQLQVRNVKEEMCRLMAEEESTAPTRRTIAHALSYLMNAELDVKTAIKNKVSSTADLDGTSMLQTFITERNTKTQIMGIDFLNGTEFFGSFGPMLELTPDILERVMTLMILTLTGKTAPLICGFKRRELPYLAAALLCRCYIPIECFETLTIETLSSYIRGAQQISAILCLHDSGRLPRPIRVRVSEIIAESRILSASNDKSEVSLLLPPGSTDSTSATTVRHQFHLMLTSKSFESLPRDVAILSRPLRIADVTSLTIIRSGLYTHGFPYEDAASIPFSAMYDMFFKASGRMFSTSKLLIVIRLAAESKQTCPMVERLCDAFLTIFYSTIKVEDTLQVMFYHAVSNVLCLGEENASRQAWFQRLQSPTIPSVDYYFSQFVTLITASTRVILSGPAFSGKGRVWKKWVGNSPHIVMSPALATSTDVYGTDDRPGLLSQISKSKAGEKRFYVVVEGANFFLHEFWDRKDEFCRIPAGDYPYIFGDSYLIITTRHLRHLDPRMTTSFTFLGMEVVYDWKLFLSECLVGVQYADLVTKTMEIFLRSIFTNFSHASAFLSNLFAKDDDTMACISRCTNLFKKWITHSKQTYELCGGDEEFLIDERAFTAQCAIFSVTWSIGLSLSADDSKILHSALLQCEGELVDLVESYDVTVKLLPNTSADSLNLLSLVSTPCGWRSFHRAQEVGFSYPWATHTNVSPQQASWFQVFDVPSRAHALKAAECLLDCGQNIILSGDPSSGRSTLMRTTRVCDRWSPCVVSCSRGINATFIQDNITSRLVLRSDGFYGPLIGRKMIVCIDDMHVTPLLEHGVTMASEVMGFCDRNSGLTTPLMGFIPVKDVVFCGTSDRKPLSSTVSRSCVPVLLPSLVGEEIATGMWELFEGCCAKKRVEGFSRQAAAFVAIAHSFFVRIVKQVELPDRMMYSSGFDALLKNSLELLPFRLRDALRAADTLRTNLSTSLPDVQVTLNAFKYMDELYSAMLSAEQPDGVAAFRDNLIRVAEVTLGICVQDVVFKDLVNHNNYLFDNVTSAQQEQVAGWVHSMEHSVDLMKTDVLEGLLTKGQQLLFSEPENANRSVLISYPSLMASAIKPGGISPKNSRKASLRVRSARVRSGTPGIVTMSRTFITTWMASHAGFLSKALRKEEMHFTFTTSEMFGCLRLLRIVCCANCMPLAFFRCRRAGYDYFSFRRELKATISYALLNDTAVVAFIPSGILRIEGATWLVDTIIRTGDVSELYSLEELAALAKGYHMAQRLLRHLTLSETLELWRRVQHCLHFIVQVDSPAMLREVCAGYPAIKHLFPMLLHTPVGDSQLRQELVQLILDENESFEEESQEEMEKKYGSKEEVARLICLVYDEVSNTYACKQEQLVEFTQLVRRFRNTMIQRIQQNAHMAHIVSGYSETGVEKINNQLQATHKKLVAMESALSELSMRYKAEESTHFAIAESAEMAKLRLQEEQDAINHQEHQFHEKEAQLKHALHSAGSALKKAKTQSIRNLSQANAPEKGSLLVRALFRTMGEELPLYNHSRSELWSHGVKAMCRANFADSFSAIRPSDVNEHAPLLLLQSDLSEVRYSGNLSYAQLVAEYILALMALIRHQDEGLDPRLRSKKEASQANLHQLISKAESAKSVVALTAKSIGDLEKACEEVRLSQVRLEEKEVRMSQFVALVDKFAEFVVGTDSRTIECVEGDIILVAAIYSLLIMHKDMEKVYQQLQGVLLERGVHTTVKWENAVRQLLFPGHSRQVDSFIPSGLPRRNCLVVYSLMARIHWRWPLIGGVCSISEDFLREYLSYQCGGCITVSSFDPVVKAEILQALKSGSGLILRDVVDTSATDLMRPLKSVLERINEIRERNMLVESPADLEKKFTTLVYGKEVNVDVKFFMVATAAPLVPCDDSSPMAKWFHVVNLHNPLPHSYRYERLLAHAPTTKNLAEDIINKRELLYDEVYAFNNSYDVAAHSIANGVAQEDPSKLIQLEEAINEVSLHYGLITQHMNQLHVMTKQHRSAWYPVEGAIKRTTNVLRFIEFSKLERPWDEHVLDVFIGTMCNLSPHLLSRIAPQIYADLPLPERHFYAIVHFLEEVLKSFFLGWPYALRSIFALLFVCEITSSTEEIGRQEGHLYPDSVALLNCEQVEVLRAVLSDKDLSTEAAQKKDDEEVIGNLSRIIAEHYKMSGDPLLMAIAEADIRRSSVEEEALVESFFIALLELNVDQAENAASHIVNGFFEAVVDSKWSTGDNGRSRDDENSHEGALRGGYCPPLSRLNAASGVLQRSVRFGVPVCSCMVNGDNDLALRRLSNFSRGQKMTYRWFNISNVYDLYPLPSEIMRLSYVTTPGTSGHCIALNIDLPEHCVKELNEDDTPNPATSELCVLLEELRRVLMTFHGRVLLKEEFTRRVGIAMFVVVSKRLHDVMWRTSYIFRCPLVRCLYVNRSFISPQRHLLDLFAYHPSLKQEDWMKPSKNQPIRGGASVRSQDSSVERNASTLESMALLMAKELTVVHVSIAQRARMRRANWKAKYGTGFPDVREIQLLNDENLSLLLELVKGWMRMCYVQMGKREDIQSPSTQHEDDESWGSPSPLAAGALNASQIGASVNYYDTAMSPMAPRRRGTIRDQVGSIFNVHENRERMAYLFYRDQLRIWDALTPAMSEENPLNATTAAEEGAELMEEQLARNIFNIFQKLASEVMCSFGMSFIEKTALYWLLRKVVVAPSSSAVVSCHFTNLSQRCPLLLDADTNFSDFEMEIAQLPSTLIELCGDGDATELYRKEMDRAARRILFFFTVTETTRRSNAPGDALISPIVRVPSMAAFGNRGMAKTLSSGLLERKINSASLSDRERPTSAALPEAVEVTTTPNPIRPPSKRDSMMLSKSELVELSVLEQSAFPWLQFSFKGDVFDLSVHEADGTIPWMLEKKRAVKVMQFYSSLASFSSQFERECLVATYECLATRRFLNDPTSSIWVPALENPVSCVSFLAAAVHRKLAALIDSPIYPQTRVEPQEECMLIITKRSLLSVGDIVLRRAHLSEALQRNVEQLTRWSSEHFPSSVVIEEEGEPAPTPEDVVIAVRLVEVSQALDGTKVYSMLESPLEGHEGSNRKSHAGDWEAPLSVEVRSLMDDDPRIFAWSLPVKPTPSKLDSQSQRTSRSSFQQQPSQRLPTPQSPSFFTGVNFDGESRIRIVSSVRIDLFYLNLVFSETDRHGEAPEPSSPRASSPRASSPRTTAKRAKEEGNQRGERGRSPSMLLVNTEAIEAFRRLYAPPTPDSSEASDSEDEVDDGRFFLKKEWRARYPATAVCVIFEKSDVDCDTIFEFPTEGFFEYYIAIQ